MRKIIAITQLSIDGVMQAPGGPDEDTSNNFRHGGWFMNFGDDILHKELNGIISRNFEILLGRKTYEIFAGYWPQHNDNPIGAAFNKANKYVVSNTLSQAAWTNTTVVNGDISKAISKIKKTDGPDIHVWGSSNLLQALVAANLIDEHRMWIAPVVLGEGKRLFEKGVPMHTLSLVGSRCTTTGMLINVSRRIKNENAT